MKLDMNENRICTIDPWHIIEKDFRPDKSEVSEAIFSLANEYMGTRGNFEEGFGGKTLQGCYLGGIYVKERQKYAWRRKCFPIFSNFMVNTTNWLRVYVQINGEEFSMSESQFSDYSRCLDMKNGILSRELVFKTKSGEETLLRWERLISHHDRHCGAIQLSIKAINHEKKVNVTLKLDSNKENQICADNMIHCQPLQKKADKDGFLLLMRVNTTGQYYIHRMFIDTHNIKVEDQNYLIGEREVGYSFSFLPKKGVQYNVDKIVSIWNSRDVGCQHGLINKNDDSMKVDCEKEQQIVSALLEKSKNHIDQYGTDSYNVIRSKHIEKVSHIWDKLDIEIVGDPAAQQGIRFCMFGLFSTYLGNDSFLNIGPKGLSGEIYWGRTFWDTESYCLPFYLFTNPGAAKNLVEYRYNTLNAARDRAKEFDYDGAMYPMTTIDGTEDCNLWQYSFFEIHINSIIAYAVFLYENVTGDKEYLYTKGIEVLIEISRFWASRAKFIPYRNGYAINRVVGPDEWNQFVNNNYYTNFTAKWVLEYTQSVLQEMKKNASEKLEQLSQKIGFDWNETLRWQDVAGKMILNYDKEMNVFVQDDMYLSLNPIAREELDFEKDIPVDYKWTIERNAQYQMSKQADVLLAMFLFRKKFSLDEKKNNYRFYEQRTVHGSSLSPCIHSILASEIGRYNQAYEYYLYASRVDLDNRNNNTYEGLHVSSMAGTWMNIVCGFGGMSYDGDFLEFSPTLPGQWQKYSFKIVYRNSVVKITVGDRKVTYQVISGQDVNAKMYGKEIKITSASQFLPLPSDFENRAKPDAVIFDLDGVIVDTAKYHYLAWKQIADEEGIYFDENINERLKGVARMDSLKIIMERSNKKYSQKELEALAEKKNNSYVKMLENISPSDTLPGIREFIDQLRADGLKVALCSASKNTAAIIEKLKIANVFDAIVTGNDILKSKPDPEGFLLASQKMGVSATNCVVIEDAFAGIEAGNRGGMKTIGIGDKTILHNADYVLPSTKYLAVDKITMLY